MASAILTNNYQQALGNTISAQVDPSGDFFIPVDVNLMTLTNIDLPFNEALRDIWYFEFSLSTTTTTFSLAIANEITDSFETLFSFQTGGLDFVDSIAGSIVTVSSTLFPTDKTFYVDENTIFGLGYDYQLKRFFLKVDKKIEIYADYEADSLIYLYPMISPIEPSKTPDAVEQTVFFNNGSTSGFKLTSFKPFENTVYSPELDVIKLRLGDTNPNSPYLTDEQYQELLEASNGNVLLATLNAARIIHGSFATAIDEKVGREEAKFSQMFDQWGDLIKDLEEELAKKGLGKGGIYAGGISNQDMRKNDSNLDNRRPAVGQGMYSGTYPNRYGVKRAKHQDKGYGRFI